MAVTGFKSVFSMKSFARSWVAILMITVLLLSLTGCDASESKITTSGGTTTAVVTIPTTTKTTGASASTLESVPSTVATTLAASSAATATAPTTTAATTAAPTTTVPVTTAATTTAITTAATTTGVTEQRMGFVISASSTGARSIRIDYVEFYTGDEAIAKAREDGSDVVYFDPALGRYVIDNDYYIRNNNPLIRTFPLAAGCRIRMLPETGGSEPTETVTYAELRTRLTERKRLMIINVVTGSCTWMDEFYLP